MGAEARGVAASEQRLAELATSALSAWTEEEILRTCQQQFEQSENVMKPKQDSWVKYTRLYLNQFRKTSSPQSVGSKLLFSKFNETYSVFAADDVAVEFLPRGADDVSKVEALNKVRRYDWDVFRGTDIWNSRLWDRLFYGYDVLDVSGWDKETATIAPRVVNPFYFYFDPLAVDAPSARWLGQIAFMTYDQLASHPDVDTEKLVGTSGLGAWMDQTGDQYLKAEKSKQVLLGTNFYQEPITPTSYVQVVRWLLRVNGKSYRIWLDRSFSTVLGWREVKGREYIVTPYYRLPRQIPGIGIPDLIEDDHRAKVMLMNYALDSAKLDAMGRVAYNQKKLVNPNDLRSAETLKHVAFNEDPTGSIVPFPRTGGLNDATIAMLSSLDNEAASALAGRMSQGAFSRSNVTATQAAIEKSKLDQMMAAVGTTFVSSEKEFWYEWLGQYRRRSGGEKIVRVAGRSGERTFERLRVSDFMPAVDPDVDVVSKVVSEPRKVMARRDLAELLGPIAQVGGDARAAVRKLLYLSDMRKEDVDDVLPPTPDELRAEGENELLSDNKTAPIHESDDDRIHIAVHARADETDARDRHIEAHVLNYLRKGGKMADGQPPKPPTAAGAAPAMAAAAPGEPEAPGGEMEQIRNIIGGNVPEVPGSVR